MARRDTKAGDPRPTYAMRLGTDERRVIEAAAAQAGMPLSAFIRDQALRAARLELAAANEPQQ